jgi:hypothetical protein
MLIQQFMDKVIEFNEKGEAIPLKESSCQEVKEASLLFNEQMLSG